MKQQILVIHGGNAFDTYAEYLDNLKIKEVTLEKIRARDWKRTLADKLGQDYDVISPMMPNGQNAKYIEWKIWFEKIFSLFDDGAILIGHSLGASFSGTIPF